MGFSRKERKERKAKMKKMMLALGYVAMLAAVVNLAGCRLYECDVDSVDVDDALLYEQVPVPDEDNAFIPLIAATNLLHRVEDECADDENEPISTEQKDRLLAENAAFFTAVETALRRPRFHSTVMGTLDFLNLERTEIPLDIMVEYLRLLGMRVERAMEAGDIPMALRHIVILIRFGKLVEEDADTFISLAFAVSIVKSACENLKDIARGQNTTLETLERIAKMLEGLEPSNASQERSVKNAYTLAKAIVELRPRQNLHFWQLAYARFALHRNETMSNLNEITRKALRGEVASDFCKKLDVGTFTPNSIGILISHEHAENCKAIISMTAEQCFKVRAAQVMVAVRRWSRANGGGFPDTLDALVPKFLPSVPTDPFDCGKALNYDSGRGIIWTVGADGNFNGEKIPGKDSYGRNSGYVVNIDGSP